MRLAIALRSALAAFRGYPLRAGLTALAIGVGVASVIAAVGIGTGAEVRIADQMHGMGANLIVVLTGPRTMAGVRNPAGRLTLTEEDAGALAAELPGVEVAAPVMRGTGQAVYENRNWSTVITGVTPDYVVAREWELAVGEMFAASDVAAASKLAILGHTVWEKLFDGADPTGETIRLRGVPLRVVGVLEPKGQSAWGQDQDDIVLVPISTARKKLLGAAQGHPSGVNTILIRVREATAVAGVREEARDLLRQRHGLIPEQDDDFRARLLEEIFAAQAEAAATMTWLLGATASLSLLAGGVGIMNMMLACVADRTREIGLRMAVGARRHDILAQFLAEAVGLSVASGILGVAAGTAGLGVAAILGMGETEVTLEAIALAVLLSTGVGVLFGLYPAHRASRLDPARAMAHH